MTNFQKARCDHFALHIGLLSPSAEEYFSRSISSAAALFSSLALNAAKSSIPFGHVIRQPQAWWSFEVKDAVRERRKAFAFIYKSGEERRACIEAARHACPSSENSKLRQGMTHARPSPKSNPK